MRQSIQVTIFFALLAMQGSCASKDTRTSTDERPSLAAQAPAKPQTQTQPQKQPRKPTSAPATVPARPPVRVLFIGNSYTFYNGGVDAVLEALARAAGRNFACAASTSGGKSLQWHWEEGDARSTIARGGWDYVVLQELSARPVGDPKLMFDYARRFDAEIKAAGAKTVFYLTWTRFHQPENQLPINRAYGTIADELDAIVARVGPAWERVLDERPSIKLHMEDRSHPTEAGTYLAACVFYATLTGDSPEKMPASITTDSGKTITLDPDVAEVLQRAASAVSKRSARVTK